MGFLLKGLSPWALSWLRVRSGAARLQLANARQKGLECDAVLRTWSGAYALAEVKLGGETLVDEGARTLNKLSMLISDKGKKPPVFMMVVTAVGEFAYRRKEDGIIVCPLSALKN